MFFKKFFEHQKLEKKRLDKSDVVQKNLNIFYIFLLISSVISGFTFYTNSTNSFWTEIKQLSTLTFYINAISEIIFKIGMAQSNSKNLVSYLLLPIKKRLIFNSRTLLDCVELYNFWCFSFFTALFIKLGFLGILNVAQILIYSLTILFTSFLLTIIIKYFKTLKKSFELISLTALCCVIVAIVYLLNTNELFVNSCKYYFSNIYVCLFIIVIEIFLIYKINYIQLSRQLNQISTENQTINSFNLFNSNKYTKLLITLCLRSKNIISTLIVLPIMGICFVIVSKSDLLPKDFDLTLFGYAFIFFGLNYILNPLITKLSLFMDGIFLRDKMFFKSMMNSFLKINFVYEFILLLILLLIFKDYKMLAPFLINLSFIPFISNLAIKFKQCARFDILSSNSSVDSYTMTIMFIYSILFSMMSVITGILNAHGIYQFGLFIIISISFISIVFLIIQKLWINKLSESFYKNRYEILKDLRK
ncbi:MAG: hypothetical protein MJ211_05105 [Bacteroidales bacterium]|nr:hypothetical protein [Bacteroidales bacterium]